MICGLRLSKADKFNPSARNTQNCCGGIRILDPNPELGDTRQKDWGIAGNSMKKIFPLTGHALVVLGLAIVSVRPVTAQPVPSANLAKLRARLPQDEVIYFLMPDRFENGDPSNDRGGLQGDRLRTGFDPTDQGFLSTAAI